jgi:signal transduction histidine kinase
VTQYEPDNLVILWFLEKILLALLVGYVTLAFRRLKKGAESIAAGDYDAKVSLRHLLWDFKSSADTLNHIQDGMSAAVDSRTRSERLKTELITNVSHDLKTPLTSIVSYVDLLKQEPVGSEAAGEYLEVLDRQSARLKKLIEDLVEASKASTGNITVSGSALDLSMLLGQALGEYTQRLENAGLTPVLRAPEEACMVWADGRLLWRVFDNLLGNIVKYALPGTRVYLTLDVAENVTVTFRNISREPLEVSAQDLMERFVRGDASRHTEGSGLGLSIARSLTESMGGSFQLEIDGDLFKALVQFPILEAE